jgi:hypothetical protein
MSPGAEAGRIVAVPLSVPVRSPDSPGAKRTRSVGLTPALQESNRIPHAVAAPAVAHGPQPT